jgi:hypothetical protein
MAPQEDLLVAHTPKEDGLTGAVILQFRHALSRVSVRAVNLIDQPVRIHSLSLHNLHVKGTLDIDEDTWNGRNDKADINESYNTPPLSGYEKYKILWDTNGQTKEALAWQLAESGVMVPVGGSPVQVTADDQALLVLPQTTQNTGNDAKVNDGDFYLEVIYTVGNITDTIQAAFNDINKLAQTNNEGLTFEMGRQYAINVSITATGLSFSLDVNNWDEPPATQFVVNFDANGGTGAATEDLLLWEAGVPYDITAPNNPYHSPQGGYTFIDWTTNADATGDHYVPGETIVSIYAGMTLYAQWARKPASPIITDFTYSGEAKTFVAPQDGYYQLEAWGAQGGSTSQYAGGNGGYCKGIIYLKKNQTLYVYVGGKGKDIVGSPGGWNGGGEGSPSGWNDTMRPGGGATDFRLVPADANDATAWKNEQSLNSRILVAAAGGGGDGGRWGSSLYIKPGGYGGGLIGQSINRQEGGTQIKGGTATGSNSDPGYFGRGGTGYSCKSGGGGGYYGGSAGYEVSGQGGGPGGGGSSFISGFTGCVAIDPADVTNDPRTQDAGTGFAKTALNFSSAVFAQIFTWKEGKEIAFTNTVMIDGAGYEWKDGVKAGTVGTMPNPDGDTMTGNSGNGYARITKWEKLE